MSIQNFNDIKHTFYINLQHRTDRNAHMQQQLSLLNIPYQRFNAISMKNGAVGCSLSHLSLLNYAINNNLEHILILEDDIKFYNHTLFINQFNKCIKNRENNWDVILLAGNNIKPYTNIDDTCIKITKCQTTTGYLVNKHYMKTLRDNIKDGIELLCKYPASPNLYAIDQYWFKLQEKDRWFLIIPITVAQLPGYSDIEKKNVNYIKLMANYNKQIK